MTTTIFERLGRERPPEEKKTSQPDHAQALLDWIHRRPGDTITARDIRNFGPRPIRNRETAIRSAQILVAHGWLSQLEPHRWKIIRQPLIPNSSP
jgi:hypothetical protein